MTDRWEDWWRDHGDGRLSLLLWAVWNPIGPVPLDEYEDYTGQVVRVLNEGRDADRQLLPPGGELTDSVQLQRNALYAKSLNKLATVLGNLRHDQMGLPPDDDLDRRAAATLIDWYEWEMMELPE